MDAIAIDREDVSTDLVLAQLQPGLAAAVDLTTRAKQARWNVRGPERSGLHQLLDVVAGETAAYSDLIADRITALGGVAEGTAHIAAERTSLPPYPLHIRGAAAHVVALSEALSSFAAQLLSAFDAVQHMGDAGTAEFLLDLRCDVSRLLRLLDVQRVG